MIGAIDTEGRVWHAVTQSNTTTDVLLLFVKNLIALLDDELPNWREESLLLLDGARYHVSAEARAGFQKLRLPVIYTAPYSPSSSPIERLWAALKLGELNPDRISTGKR